MYSFYYNLFAKYDKNNFYVICLSLNKKKDDAYTEKIKSLVDEYIDIGDLSREDMAEKIKSMNVDILVDLAGHSANSGLSLFAYRVAPVQISGLGWMETTGFSAVDYLITDEYLDPTGNTYITERPLYLKSQFCYKCHRDVVASSGAPCIKNGYITFATFNRISKFTSEILELWRRIMYLVPNSFLLLKCDILSSKSNMQMVRKRLANAGLDNKRIILESPSLDYLERYLDVDIALDTYPYTGGVTTFDALYMGVPVVSLYGERHSSRFGLSILTNAGVGELAVPTPKEYVERAVALASDWDLLDVLHKNLRTMLENSPAMDAEGYVREIEGKYKEILSAVHNHDVFD